MNYTAAAQRSVKDKHWSLTPTSDADKTRYARFYDYEENSFTHVNDAGVITKHDAPTGNISSIALKYKGQNTSGRETIGSTNYTANYDKFLRLKNGLGSAWIKDENRQVHPGFDSSSPYATCYAQDFDFDDRNNVIDRTQFTFDDILRKQNYVRKLETRHNVDISRVAEVVWKYLFELTAVPLTLKKQA